MSKSWGRAQGGSSRQPRVFFLALLVCLALGGWSAANASALRLGVTVGTANDSMKTVQLAGAKVWRVQWSKPSPQAVLDGSFLAGLDAQVQKAWEYGITVEPVLDDGGPTGRRFPTTGFEEWKTWVRKLVERYGTNGSFWATHGPAQGHGKRPITGWEIWNEPNLAENSPVKSKDACEAAEKTYSPTFNSCPQPGAY